MFCCLLTGFLLSPLPEGDQLARASADLYPPWTGSGSQRGLFLLGACAMGKSSAKISMGKDTKKGGKKGGK